MEERVIQEFVKKGSLKRREKDFERARTLLLDSVETGEFLQKINIDDSSSRSLFHEYYRVIRQLGDALWWIRGYEARQHEPSIILIEELLTKKQSRITDANSLRIIRHEATYKGFKIDVEHAERIREFWIENNETLKKVINNDIDNN